MYSLCQASIRQDFQETENKQRRPDANAQGHLCWPANLHLLQSQLHASAARLKHASKHHNCSLANTRVFRVVPDQTKGRLTQETICHIGVGAHEVDHTASAKAVANSGNAVCIRKWLLHCLQWTSTTLLARTARTDPAECHLAVPLDPCIYNIYDIA